jgi:hypothetical protein
MGTGRHPWRNHHFSPLFLVQEKTRRPKVVLHAQNQRSDPSIALVVLVAGLIISIGRHIRLDIGHFWAQPHCCA